MTLLLTHDDVRMTVTMKDAILAMESAFSEEGEGATLSPPRINMTAGGGWLRVGPVSLERSGWAGFKAMNLAPGHGVRYQVHLYKAATGELVAIMDAQHLTTLRTGATSAVATRRLARPGPGTVALLGSSVEARAQLDAMQEAGYVKSARVFSPTEPNRNKLVQDYRRQFDMEIVAVGNAEEAIAGADIVAAAVKSKETVVYGRWLKPGAHVNSVGTARRDQREIDPETFVRSARIIVDTKEGVLNEAGDAVVAKDALKTKEIHELSALVAGSVSGRAGDDEITLFKSVGTGIQDIALAAVIYERAKARGVGTDIGTFPYLKRQ